MKNSVSNLSKTDYVNLLKNFICNVTFEKADGSCRILKCTLLFDYLPKISEKEEDKGEKKIKKQNENQVNVFDLEKESWRSFIIEKVKKVEVVGK